MDHAIDKTTVATACRMCGEDCGINVHMKEGRVLAVEGIRDHPNNKGQICIKAEAIPAYLYSSDRLKHPLLRVRDKWKKISWNEALNRVATKLIELKDKGEESRLAIFQGYGVGHYEIKWFMQRFADLYGTPNFSSVANICFTARPIGHTLTYGGLTVARFEETNCVVLWGANPYASSYPRWGIRVMDAKNRGAKLIVIDPAHNFFSDKADLLLQPLPGTDLALALGFMNIIIKEELYDKEFVRKWTIGFDLLKEHVVGYTPRVVAKITSIPEESIKQAARMYGQIKPACIHQGYGLEAHLDGVQTCRALAMLHALTGNLDIQGGNMFGTRLPTTMLRFLERVNEKSLDSSEYPAMYKIEHSAHLRGLLTAILDGHPYQVKALIIAGGNPALTWPNTKKVIEALQKLELLVVIDPYMTETAKFAHIILPAATFLERFEHSGYHIGTYIAPYIMLRREVVPPIAEARPDILIWAEIAKRLDMKEYFPWNNLKEAIQALIAPSTITIEQLEKNPAGMYYDTKRFKSYEEKGFNTPSKKVEFYSEYLNGMGQDPIPTSHGMIKLSDKYPLILMTGLRYQEYVHSQHRNIQSLRCRQQEPFLHLNPETAETYEIGENDSLILETQNGKIEIKAKLNKCLHRYVVALGIGWNEANVNFLTDWNARDPISGFPNLKSIHCKIWKK